MSIAKIENETLGKSVTQYEKLVVIYTSQSCENCLKLYPKIVTIASAKKYKDLNFLEIDAEDNAVAGHAIQAHQTPLVTVYKKGLIIDSKTVKSLDAFRSLIETLI